MSDLGIAVRTQFGLLGEWWCVAVDASEDDCLAVIAKEFIQPIGPTQDPELVRDRLFGGFQCLTEPGRRHVYFSTGHYTYLNPTENGPLSDEERRAEWAELIEHNGEPGNGPFTAAGPVR